MTYGIAAVDWALGDPIPVAEAAPSYTEQLRRVAGWGYRTFHRATDDTGLTDLATEAGRRALDRAGITAADIDLVVLAMADIPEYLYWDAAASTQARLGAFSAEACLVNQACSSGVVAFDFVAGKFATHPEYRKALLISAHKVCEPYWNRMESGTAVASDGAAAAVLVRGHTECSWLATEIISDGRYADAGRLPVGGEACPFTADAPKPAPVGPPDRAMKELLGGDPRALVKFVRQDRHNNRTVLERACRRAGIPYPSVRRVLYMNGTLKGLEAYAQELGIPREDTNAPLAADYGHFGCVDQLLSLGLLLESGELASGEPLALTSTGSGMHWACTLLRV
ncbi:3-oxoacyl-[acyl-carrier-protein] synthase III C-terminal domain-containing protein [Streptomyces sp. NPDC056004]|uniref:3-oxoacyl-[acyl-carrier-protein] synthase III C-terminal domain-containing protein n=1 Tax=Streptomyces sp. NPDC056004 TaxID=3345677 RepID=UPI0035DC1933